MLRKSFTPLSARHKVFSLKLKNLPCTMSLVEKISKIAIYNAAFFAEAHSCGRRQLENAADRGVRGGVRHPPKAERSDTACFFKFFNLFLPLSNDHHMGSSEILKLQIRRLKLQIRRLKLQIRRMELHI
ncbi:MAG: hypothetical protein D8H92_07460 [Campylobacter sp.]|nr:MAG: hypothetical protein D8H92_07460 [Campylobacter sp.]